ncbi:16S rRNA (guanine966-N2)-methyltransferase [Poseidonocella pacifica]|uniref:16S rRNA (Guanine966-N2)-methyltransferase n=1 Tax=Poseidonocella pacifica TaxID=871651 RepID=A0A1I0Y0X5_9RHOB|nr:16S rRNA (guanine(966)-N(2))-methyltransferase RsmD [Poseidonocella pacifica]SFB06260.1 16S rRNA (guanine966-N2)-methyltransferase [Poseidonocella pacifica]
MRIIAGAYRGHRLAAVGKGDPAAHLRPTTDRLRETLFNVLAAGKFGTLSGSVVLDLFAGTGALGLEALSRGAVHATFVDDGRAAQKLILDNIKRLRLENARLLSRDATRLPKNDGALATLVFLDPPYGKDLGARALGAASAGGWLAPGALVIWEENAQQPAPEGFEMLDHRRYGDTSFTFLRHGDGPAN